MVEALAAGHRAAPDYIGLAVVFLELFDYIEVFYNRKRMHSSLGYVSPAEFERNASVLKLAA